jgi:hypothetical protein
LLRVQTPTQPPRSYRSCRSRRAHAVKARIEPTSALAEHIGMAGALRVMSPIIRSILAGANTTRLRAIVGHIRHLM